VANRKRSHTHFLLGTGRTQKKKKKKKKPASMFEGFQTGRLFKGPAAITEKHRLYSEKVN
jgi:hypothetical protein